MIWVDFSPQVGGEMKDEHPMMVLSTKAFAERMNIVIGLPMTHAASNKTNPFAVKFAGAKGEIGYVLTHQPKSFDWRARICCQTVPPSSSANGRAFPAWSLHRPCSRPIPP